jgi:nicotinamide-nucleotide amidase
MRIEIINTGSELLLGRVLNTHQQWLCRKLADAGYETTRQVAVADTGQAIQEAVREAMGRAELILVTGGLGPTSDDITRDKIAELLGCELHEDAAVVDHVREFFTRRNRPMPDRVRIQAMVPAGAEVIGNDHGTAPGLLMAFGEAGCLVMLPGPPRELRPMFAEKVLPRIRDRFPLEDGFSCRTLKSTGIGESQMEEMLEQPLAEHVRRGLVVGFCARPARWTSGWRPGVTGRPRWWRTPPRSPGRSGDDTFTGRRTTSWRRRWCACWPGVARRCRWPSPAPVVIWGTV